MVWHYHDDDLAGPAAEVSLELSNLPGDVRSLAVENFLIDASHSNAYTAWLKMGSPQAPSAEQYAELERAGQLANGDAIAPVAVGGRGGDGEDDASSPGRGAVGAARRRIEVNPPRNLREISRCARCRSREGDF